MELRQLRYFAAVAAHGSFSRAAKELHLTQPAVSRQVLNLEEELGSALLRRTNNAVTLTAAGEQFYEEARDLLTRADQAIRRVRAQASSATLRISYVASLVAGVSTARDPALPGHLAPGVPGVFRVHAAGNRQAGP